MIDGRPDVDRKSFDPIVGASRSDVNRIRLNEVEVPAERATLEGQDHGPAPEVLAPVLVEFFGR